MIQTFITPDLNFLVSLVLLESDATKDAAVEQLQKQINDIVQELNLLKEQQALQTGKLAIPFMFPLIKE